MLIANFLFPSQEFDQNILHKIEEKNNISSLAHLILATHMKEAYSNSKIIQGSVSCRNNIQANEIM